MNTTLVSDPSKIHQLWTKFYQDIGLGRHFTVPVPTFTKDKVEQMQNREVPRLPMPNNTKIGRNHILDLGTRSLKISWGTYETIRHLSRVPNSCDDSDWVFVEASYRAPHSGLLQTGWTAEAVLSAQRAVGLSYEDYAVFMLYRRRVLGMAAQDSATSLLLGSQTDRPAPGSVSNKAVVYGFFHWSDGLSISDNMSEGQKMLGLGLWTKIPA